jgi:hypothetical protein
VLGILAIVLAVSALAKLGAHLLRIRRARRTLDRAPQAFEDRARVTLTGTVKLPERPLIAPLSGRECVAYSAIARTYIVEARKRRRLDQELGETKATQFILATLDGDVVVDGELVDIPIRASPVIPRKLDRERAFLDRAELGFQVAHAGFEEIVITVGMKIRVNGVAASELTVQSVGETGFREAPRHLTLGGKLTIAR